MLRPQALARAIGWLAGDLGDGSGDGGDGDGVAAGGHPSG
jgi:hypothetical protein